MANGRSIVVRVNDRGPFAHNRVIDLSKKTAAVLDFKDKGTAKVRVQFVGDAPLDGQDEQFLVASYQGPGPGPKPSPQLANASSEPIVTAYSAPPAARPATAFPDALAKNEIDRAVVESGTPFDPSKASGKILRGKTEAAAAQGSAVAKNSYAVNERVSVAFAAIDELVR
jgi:rare lipoprotein A